MGNVTEFRRRTYIQDINWDPKPSGIRSHSQITGLTKELLGIATGPPAFGILGYEALSSVLCLCLSLIFLVFCKV